MSKRRFVFARMLAVWAAVQGVAAWGGDLKLWYDKVPTAKVEGVLTDNGVWGEALLIGNGRLGGQVWGGVREERIDLNEANLWTGEPGYEIGEKGKGQVGEIRKLLVAGDFLGAQKLWTETIGAGAGHASATYLPMGDLRVAFEMPEGEISGYRRELDLEMGVVKVTFQVAGVTYTREVLASKPDGAIVMRVTASERGKVSFSAGLESQLKNKMEEKDGVVMMGGQAPMRSPGYSGKLRQPTYAEGKGIQWTAGVGVKNEGGTVRVADGKVVAEKCDAVTLYVTAFTNSPLLREESLGIKHTETPPPPAEQTVATVRSLQSQRYEEVKKKHVEDYRELFGRVTLDLGESDAGKLPTDERLMKYGPGKDPGLAALYYQFGRYMMISASRARAGGQPSNLQGIWNSSLNPAWSSNWTINCNAEINYWPVEAGNLAECHEPLLQMVRELSVDGGRVARDVYGAKGEGAWMAHHATDVWRFAAPCGGDAKWSAFPSGGTWFCQHLWEHYAFSQDNAYLESVWPLMKGAARFNLEMLVEEPEHHWLVVAPDLNFENAWKTADGKTGSLCYGSTATIQMVRQLFKNCVMASKVLGTDGELRTELEKTLPRLAPMQVSPTTGELQEWVQDWQRTAKGQVLSSWGAMCSDQITPRGTPELAAALRKIYDTERFWERDMVGSWEGAFQGNVYARLHDGDKALAVLDRHFQKAVLPNLGSAFIGHPPGKAGAPHPGMFQVDGNFGQTSAIQEMLLQSQVMGDDGVYEVELLPALPKAWAKGEVKGLRARGGVTVDITWEGGKLIRAKVTSTVGVPVKVRYGETAVPVALKKGEERQLGLADFGGRSGG